MAKAAKPKTPSKPEPPAAAPAVAATPAPRPAPRKTVGGTDPALEALTQGLAALQAKDWAKAVKHFELAVEQSDQSEVKDRAKQFLTVSRQRAQGSEAKPAGKAAAAQESDPYLQAVYEKNRGNLQEALEISRKGGQDQKDERFAYLAASIHAVESRWDDATQALTRAVELNPKNRIHAFHDPDFAELRKNRDLRPLFGLS